MQELPLPSTGSDHMGPEVTSVGSLSINGVFGSTGRVNAPCTSQGLFRTPRFNTCTVSHHLSHCATLSFGSVQLLFSQPWSFTGSTASPGSPADNLSSHLIISNSHTDPALQCRVGCYFALPVLESALYTEQQLLGVFLWTFLPLDVEA